MEVLNELEKHNLKMMLKTLADIPDRALQRNADRETMGVRQIIDVEDETQPNGKVFKKVFIFFVFFLKVCFG